MIEIIKTSNGEKADELRERIVELINEYSNVLTGYELIGVIDTIKQDCHISIQEGANEE